jgi:hypothetical protein
VSPARPDGLISSGGTYAFFLDDDPLEIQSGFRFGPTSAGSAFAFQQFHVDFPDFWIDEGTLLAIDGPRPVVGDRYWRIRFPHWSLVALTAILPVTRGLAFLHRSRQHHRRAARGLCPTCGYDLRATPGRCPECGKGVLVQTAGADR